MTGPAPRYNLRWDDPGRNPPDAGVSLLTGRFRDGRLEAAFRRQVWHEWSSRLRIVTLLASALQLLFAYSDYLALGPGAPLYVCWALRVAVLVGALGIGVITRQHPHIQRLDWTLFALLLLFSCTAFAAVALQQKGVTFEAAGIILMVLGFYVFVPTRFEIQLASGLFVSAGFLLIAVTLLAPTEEELFTVALEILICNVLGAVTAVGTHLLQRREFVGLRQVQQRARFEELVARLSTRFITLAPGEVSAQIQAALAEVGEFTGADRAYVFELDPAQEVSSCSYEWCRDGIAPAMRALQRVPYDRHSWVMTELLAGRAIAATRLADLPPAAAVSRDAAAAAGARSLLVLPLVLDRRMLGAIGFHAVRREIAWGAQRIAVLRLVGDMIIGMLVRTRAKLQLDEQARTLEASVAALERSNGELQHFAYVASHDLQEPLRSISSFSSLLAQRYQGRLDATADDYIGYLKAAAQRMHDLIGGLLSYSRLDIRARSFTRCALASAVTEALANLHASIEEARAEICIGALPDVQGDPSQLVQLFQNLIGNAVKFHDAAPPRVHIDARRAGGQVEVAVADNGIGIDERHADRIFQPFTRLHTPEQYPGTGIGLAVCRRIVERHHGRIWVERNTPRGTVFRFTLPVTA